jgi:16S rRNA (cytosine1402-N4)-methyltransferase
MHQAKQTVHVPVLLDAVLTYLTPQPGQSYLDVTAGYGGHATAVIKQTQAPERAVLVDRDATAIAALEPWHTSGAQLMHDDFLRAAQQLLAEGRQFDMILADLGVSSLHIDTADRGFAFSRDGPLDMRMDQRGSITAADIVNTYDEAALTTLLHTYGEEHRARTIAKALVASRPFATTRQLAETVARVMPKGARVHPATKTFQAIRIAVNDELELLKKSLPLWLQLLAPGGRLTVISFHSLEDRVVKQLFHEVAGERYDAEYALCTKNPVVANDTEIAFNPRSRSAKLRAVAKINIMTA